MGSLQFRLFASYIVIIGVTLGLAALSLFLLLGGYRNDITYGNLEDLSVLVNALAVRQDTDQPGTPEPPAGVGEAEALLSTLRNVLSGEQNQETSVALVDRSGRVLAGYAAPSGVNLDDASVTGADLGTSASGGRVEPVQCDLEVPGRADLLCVVTPLTPGVLEQLPETEASHIVVAKPAASLGEVFGD
ncbi:MAG: hypothetical protein ACRDHF_19135, partial [Tepidiformaceae bacterium]